MKYPQVVSMPSAVSDWLQEQLEARGIDSEVYTRYILSLLHAHTLDLIYPEEEYVFPPLKKEGGRGYAVPKRVHRASNWWKHAHRDPERIKRSAAVECLMSAADQNCEIESLVDELCEKLKEVDSEPENTPIKSNQPIGGYKKIPKPKKVSPKELAERYYAAFPPLNQKVGDPYIASNINLVVVDKWPATEKSLDKIDFLASKWTTGPNPVSSQINFGCNCKPRWLGPSKKLKKKHRRRDMDINNRESKNRTNTTAKMAQCMKSIIRQEMEDDIVNWDNTQNKKVSCSRDGAGKQFMYGRCMYELISKDGGAIKNSENYLEKLRDISTRNWAKLDDKPSTPELAAGARSAFARYSSFAIVPRRCPSPMKTFDGPQPYSRPFGRPIKHPEFPPHVVPPRLDKNQQHSEDMWGSPELYFRPIKSPLYIDTSGGHTLPTYPDGTTFAVYSDWDESKYQLNGNGRLFLESPTLGEGVKEYQLFMWPDVDPLGYIALGKKTPLHSSFVPKFEVKQHDKACQTDPEPPKECLPSPQPECLNDLEGWKNLGISIAKNAPTHHESSKLVRQPRHEFDSFRVNCIYDLMVQGSFDGDVPVREEESVLKVYFYPEQIEESAQVNVNTVREETDEEGDDILQAIQSAQQCFGETLKEKETASTDISQDAETSKEGDQEDTGAEDLQVTEAVANDDNEEMQNLVTRKINEIQLKMIWNSWQESSLTTLTKLTGTSHVN